MARCWLVAMPLPSLTMTNYIGIVFAVVYDDTDDDENDYNIGTNDFHTVMIIILIIIIPIMIITITMTMIMIMIMIIVIIICKWTPVMFNHLSAWIPWGQRLDNLKSNIWWRHQMETFSALLAICAGNSPVTGNKGQWRGALMFSLICVWINGWVNNREAGDFRRHCDHHDVIVMVLPGPTFCLGTYTGENRLRKGHACLG